MLKADANQEIIEIVWNDKYRYKLADGTSDEKTPADSKTRMVKGVYTKDPSKTKKQEALDACLKELLLPGGRVAAGAGTPKRVTWINCFVNRTIDDSMEGIMSVLTETALTMQQGGGVGTDFSTIRPSGAVVNRTGSVSTGIIPFMRMWNSMCGSIKSSGSRRGAMMATLADWHPDLPKFITAKQEKGELTNFNVSVLVSDAFLKAVEENKNWDLGFHVSPADTSKIIDSYEKNGNKWYVYQRMKAVELWELIIKNTYEWAEPGIVFIDRVNYLNNLNYCESIRCTNPCITGDTKILVAGRGAVPIKQLAEEGKDAPVFAHNFSTGETVVRWGRNPRLTRKNSKLVKVNLDDGSFIRCSPDHRVPLRDGSEKEAAKLVAGDSLIRVDSSIREGGETLIDGKVEYHYIAEAKYECKFKWGTKKGDYHTHHINENHFDNSWDNIEVKLAENHNSDHRSGDGNPMRFWWNSRTEDEKETYRQTMRESVSGENNPMFGKHHQLATLRKIGDKTIERHQDPEYKKRFSEAVSASMTPEVRQKMSSSREHLANTFVKICLSCGNEFQVRAISLETGDGKRKYCSAECASTKQSKTFTKVCVYCKKEFEVRAESLDTHIGKNPRCYDCRELRKRSQTFTKVCVGCGNEFEVKARSLETATRQRTYCTVDCSYLYRNSKKEINHKVVSVEILTETEDVYNITVDELHNYFIITTDKTITKASRNNKVYSYHKLSGVNYFNCGEQVLPPFGICNLSHCNLAKMVDNPFQNNASFNYSLLAKIARTAVRFSDNVIESSPFPLKEQQDEAQNKRRIGLGYSGLANAMQMLQVRYGHKNSIGMTESIGQVMRDAAYWESVELAKERGPFPLFDKDKYMKGKFIKTLPQDLQDAIAQNGIRNGVLLTIAPVGTGSLYYGNISSGIEPTIFWKASRKMLMPDNTYKEFDVVDYGYLEFCKINGDVAIKDLPYYMVTSNDLTVDEHLAIQAEAQKYIDSSISKTINCPESISYEDFKQVYKTAYDLGCKGCTTYRPSGVRGAVITEKKAKIEIQTVKRPDVLPSTSYKVKMPGVDQAFYLTISDIIDNDGVTRPFEMFINSKSVKHHEWITALTRTISAIFRRGGDVTFLIEELEQVYSMEGGGFKDGKYVPSLVALIGQTIKEHLERIGLLPSIKTEIKKVLAVEPEVCPQCQQKAYFHQEGCGKCNSCGFSNCG